MTDNYVLTVDATFNVKVKVGDIVKKGMELGRNPDNKRTLVSYVSGRVSDIYFNPENHTFEIKIERILPHSKI